MNNPNIPRIAIVGRPNVGKSTLFNRLSGRHRAITAAQPGVTRDPVEEQIMINDLPCRLIDTGGFRIASPDNTEIDERVVEKALARIDEANLILFVAAVGEWSAEDQALCERLRRENRMMLLVVNKVDGIEQEADAWNYLNEGFETMSAVSARHNRGIDKLLNLMGTLLPKTIDEPARQKPLRLALIGKPNVGKSTLSNHLLGEERSIVSSTAGTTRDVLRQSFRHGNRDFELIDTAGIRRRSKVKEGVEHYAVNRAIGVLSEVDVAALMIDIQMGLSEQDKKIAWQIIKNGCGIIFLLSKSDLIDDRRQRRNLERQLIDFFPTLDYAPQVSVSAVDGSGVDQFMRMVCEIASQRSRRIPTAALNTALADWQLFNPIHRQKNRVYKVRYITQSDREPPLFVAFVNRLNGFPESYRRYMENQIRRDFKMSMTPLHVKLRESGADSATRS